MSKRILGEEGDRQKDKRLFQARKGIGERGCCGRCGGIEPRLRSNQRSLEEKNLLSLWQVRLRMFYWDSKTELWGLLSTMPGQGLLGTGLSRIGLGFADGCGSVCSHTRSLETHENKRNDIQKY